MSVSFNNCVHKSCHARAYTLVWCSRPFYAAPHKRVGYARLHMHIPLTDCIGWHVYGLLQRSDKKYEEAIKCYRNALKWDKVKHLGNVDIKYV